MLYQVHLAWAGFELAMLVVIGTDFIGRNYYTVAHIIAISENKKNCQIEQVKNELYYTT